MSASAERGPGRPPGISEATLEKQRRVRRAAEAGIAVVQIAAMEECAPSYVRMLINGRGKEDGAPEPVAGIEPPQPRRLSRRSAQARALDYAEQHVISKLGLAVDAFWVRIVGAIHQEGDGYRLRIGEPASRFRSRDDLVDLFGRREVQINDWIAALVERGRLLDFGGIDIGIPHGMKLTPAENIRAKPGAKRAAKAPQDGQEPMLYSVPGGLSNATEIPPGTQIKPQLNLHSAELNLRSCATETPISLASGGLAYTASAAANAQEVQYLNSSSSNGSRAITGASEIGVSVAPNANLIPPSGATEPPPACNATEINLQRSGLAETVASLMRLAGIDRAPNAEDIGVVDSWRSAAIPADAMSLMVESGMQRRKGIPPTSLRYFDGAMWAMSAASRQPVLPSGKSEPVPAPEPPDEPIVGASLEAQWGRVRQALGKGISRNWLGKSELVGLEEGELTIALPSQFIRDHVAGQHGARLAVLWRHENPEIEHVNFALAAHERRMAAG
jgi:hypothetical protein